MKFFGQAPDRATASESRRRRRRMPLLIAAALAFAVLPPATSATNWGAGKSGVLADMCSAYNEPQYWKSECTGDNQLWLVYIYSQVPANLRTSLTNSVNNDYNPIAGITGAR